MASNQKICLASCVQAIWKSRRTIAVLVAVVTCGAIFYSFLMPNVYLSETVIIPVSGAGSSPTSGFLSSIPLLGGLANDKTSNFLIYLNSRSLKARVVRSLNLLPRFVLAKEMKNLDSSQQMERATTAVGGMVQAEVDHLLQNEIIIRVRGDDPELVTKIAKQYLVELQNFIAENSLTQAKRSRLFLEEQIAKNKEELLEMGKLLASFYGKDTVSEVRAKLNVPVALNTGEEIRNFKNYEEFKQHFDVLQTGNEKDVDQSVRYVKDVPHQVYLKYLTVQQQVLESDYAMLSQSYESAKLEEAKQEPSFQVLDEPIVPKYRYSPNRKGVAMKAFLVSLFLGIFYALWREFGPAYGHLEFLRPFEGNEIKVS